MKKCQSGFYLQDKMTQTQTQTHTHARTQRSLSCDTAEGQECFEIRTAAEKTAKYTNT